MQVLSGTFGKDFFFAKGGYHALVLPPRRSIAPLYLRGGMKAASPGSPRKVATHIRGRHAALLFSPGIACNGAGKPQRVKKTYFVILLPLCFILPRLGYGTNGLLYAECIADVVGSAIVFGIFIWNFKSMLEAR